MASSGTYLDKPSLWTVIVTAVLILILVTLGVVARFVLDELLARIVLISFIILVVIIGLSALTVLEIRKRKAQKYNKTLEQKNGGYIYKNIKQASQEPSAPKDTSWDYNQYSNRETMPVTNS